MTRAPARSQRPPARRGLCLGSAGVERMLPPRTSDRVMALILIACVMMLPLSILDAKWAPRAGALLLVSLLGLACGALIAPTRLARAVRWTLVLAGGLLLAVSNAGLINVATPVARIRVMSWWTDLIAGRVVEDPGLVTLWVTLLVWWAGYSAAHGIASGGRALDALLPTWLPLAINAVYNQQLLYIPLSLSGLVILMAWTTQEKRQANWSARQVDYPDLWPDWILGGLSIACAVCALALLFPPLTSKTTVAWMSHALDQPVSQARRFALRFLGGATIGEANRISPRAPGQESLATLPTHRLITDPPQLSDQVVMVVETDEPPPLPPSVPQPSLRVNQPGWRGMTYAVYTGRGWSNPPLTVTTQAAVPSPSFPALLPQGRFAGSRSPRPLGEGLGERVGPEQLPLTSLPLSSTLTGNVTQQFDVIAPHGDTLYAINEPVSGSLGLKALLDSAGVLVGLRGTLDTYTVTSRVIRADEETLRNSTTAYPPEIMSYLELPSELPRRVRDLTAQVAGDAATPYDKAARIETFLRTYSYTLDLPPLPEGRDLVDYFLFEAPGGYCDYYASAMVVMLRVVGVPARLASGYARGVYDYEHGAYRVIGADAHSWPEVYFAGIGWVEFEPTAARPAPARESWQNQRPPVIASAGQARTAEVRREQLIKLAWIVAGLTLLAAVTVAYSIRRQRQLAALPAGAVIPLLYQRLRKRGAWLGLAVRPSDTPDEFVAAFQQAVSRRADARATRWQAQAEIVQQAAARIGELYRQASYSPRQPGKQEARQAWEAWRALRFRVWLVQALNLVRA